MNQEITICHFECPTDAGRDLAERVERRFHGVESDGRRFVVRRVRERDLNQSEMVRACLADDVVIFDGSLDQGEEHSAHYDALNMMPLGFDHALVVSRGALPLNVTTSRDGGTRQGNEEITAWIVEQVEELKWDLPRPPELRMSPEGSLIAQRERVVEIERKLLEHAIKRRHERAQRAGTVFLSYLSRYSETIRPGSRWDGRSVEDFINDPQFAERKIHHFKPGAVSSEFMTEFRRWQVYSTIDWRMRGCEEFWVFDTPDYRSSWWTLLELVGVANIRQEDRTGGPVVKRVKRTNEGWTLEALPEDYIPTLGGAQRDEFMRFLSNADPFTAGPESVANMRALRQMPRLVRRLNYAATEGAMWAASRMFGGFVKEVASADYSFAKFEAMVHSRVFDESFERDHIVTCPRCASTTRNDVWDLDAFLAGKLPGMHRIEPDTLERLLDARRWTCPTAGCATQYRIEERPPSYLWWPVRVGRRTGPEGRSVQTIPAWHLAAV